MKKEHVDWMEDGQRLEKKKAKERKKNGEDEEELWSRENSMLLEGFQAPAN